LKEYQVCAEMD